MPHFTRRAALLLAFTWLVACTQPTLETGDAQPFVVRSVTVDASQITGVTGREFDRAPRKIGQDIRAALKAALARPGKPNADLSLSLRAVQLTSPGAAAAFGGNSRIVAVLTLTDASTGSVLIPATQITGFSETVRIPGVIGAATSPSVANDYQQTVDGFAMSVRDQLYGVPAAS